jgi:hypothetical protein
MKTTKQTKNKRTILIASITALALVGAISTYFYVNAMKADTATDTSIDTPAERAESDEMQSENLQNNPEEKDKAPNTDHPTAPTTTTESNKKQVQMIASTDRSDTTVYIRGGVNYPVIGGSCYALLTGPSSQSVRKDSSILSNPASVDCKTIAISISELAPGEWTFMLHYTSDDFEGVSDEISFTV